MSLLRHAVPNTHAEHTLHDSTEMPMDTIEITFTVSVAGVIPLQMRSSATDVSPHFAVGTHTLKGRYKLAKSTGATATLLPATKIYCKGYTPGGSGE